MPANVLIKNSIPHTYIIYMFISVLPKISLKPNLSFVNNNNYWKLKGCTNNNVIQ